MLVEPIILVIMGAAMLVAGWQGFRIRIEPDGAGVDDSELRRRRIMVRGGSYACLVSGSTLVMLAAVVTYYLVTLLGTRRLL